MAPNLLSGVGMRVLTSLRTYRGLGAAGLALSGITLAAALASAAGFLDPVSLLITVGGTLAVARATFSHARIDSAWRHLLEALAGDTDFDAVIIALKRFARVYRVDGAPALERAAATVSDRFLKRAIGLTLECRDETELGDALLGEARQQAGEGEAARQVLVTLGKLFPAFGLIGTLIGLVLLLRNLAGASFASIGPGLGIAVLTTLYGAVLANVVVLPLATKLQAHLARRMLLMQMIIEGALLVHRNEYPTRIERVLRAYIGGTVEETDDGPVLTERAA